jgi:hypothetical protein
VIVAVLAGGRGRRQAGGFLRRGTAHRPAVGGRRGRRAAAMLVAKPATPLRATLEAFAAAFDLDDPRLVASINTFEELVAAERT